MYDAAHKESVIMFIRMSEIIPQTQENLQPVTWKQALARLITSPKELLERLEIDERAIGWQWDKQFPLRVSESFMLRMRKSDPNDPLLRQVLSVKEESQITHGYSIDPLDEQQFNPIPGLLHKYPNRVLITFASSCAIHCRYCFRRHFPYSDNNVGKKGWSSMMDYLKAHPQITEVILSGGDPLMADDRYLKEFIDLLATVPQVKLLRFHTRLPIVIPNRITNTLMEVLSSHRFKVTMIYHVNHPAEITDEIANYAEQLKKHDVLLLNQSVLLKHINNEPIILKELSFRLFESGILPYYVHLLDKVAGTQHFDIPLHEAKAIEHELRGMLPGYLMPTFVQEIAGAQSKIPLHVLSQAP